MSCFGSRVLGVWRRGRCMILRKRWIDLGSRGWLSAILEPIVGRLLIVLFGECQWMHRRAARACRRLSRVCSSHSTANISASWLLRRVPSHNRSVLCLKTPSLYVWKGYRGVRQCRSWSRGFGGAMELTRCDVCSRGEVA